MSRFDSTRKRGLRHNDEFGTLNIEKEDKNRNGRFSAVFLSPSRQVRNTMQVKKNVICLFVSNFGGAIKVMNLKQG
jgi:hypothetical protein